jgi:hypothetical protein
MRRLMVEAILALGMFAVVGGALLFAAILGAVGWTPPEWAIDVAVMLLVIVRFATYWSKS